MPLQLDLCTATENQVYMGFGTGMDFGRLGAKIEYLPVPYIGVFGGFGYNIESLGINGGLSFKMLPNRRLSPTIQAMYGYNGVIVIRGMSSRNKTYYGPSLGAGLDWKVGRQANKLFFGVYYPFRSDEFYDDLDALKNDPFIHFDGEPAPLLLALVSTSKLPRDGQTRSSYFLIQTLLKI